MYLEWFNKLEEILISKRNIIDINENLINNENHFSTIYINCCNKSIYIFNKIKKIYSKYTKEFLSNFPFVSEQMEIRKEVRKLNKKEKLLLRFKNNKKVEVENDLFLEIESIITYFFTHFKMSKKRYHMQCYSYHFDKMLFLYLYSSFDIIATLIDFNENKEEYDDPNYKKIIYFTKIDSYINKNKNLNLYNDIFNIIESNSFKYINKKRNNLQHNFTHPLFFYTFKVDIMITFIILLNLIEIIFEYYK